MRSFRVIAACACASSAMGCTLWYLTADPYDGLGGDSADVIDSAPSDAIDEDALVFSVTEFDPIASGITAITTYGDKLYTNDMQGRVSTCVATPCNALVQVVAANTPAGNYRGLAVDDSGIFWSVANGIWVASLDGGNAKEPIIDPNVPQILAVDGTRVSWTTRDDGGTAAVIHSCANARNGNGCNFPPTVVTLEAGMQATGEGGPTELVGASGDVDNDELAAGPGYVAWVANSKRVSFTYVDGATVAPAPPENDPFMQGQTSTSSHVTNDGPTVFFTYSDTGKKQLLVRRSTIPSDAAGTEIYYSSQVNKSPCFAAGGGRIAFCSSSTVTLADEGDGGVRATIAMPDAGGSRTLAVTSKEVFMLTGDNTLWRATRTD